MIKFPKIRQFRDVVRSVQLHHDFKGKDAAGNPIYEHTSDYPTLVFEGSVKLHGTNAAVVFDAGGHLHAQSRERVITPEDDNAGFAAFIDALPAELKDGASYSTAVYGEWCGGNIQKGVAITGLDKMFVIFAYRDLDDDTWSNPSIEDVTSDPEWTQKINDMGIYHIRQFPTFKIEIDFNRPELATAQLAELTQKVGDQCPVGAHFNKEGAGEGIVWKCESYGYRDPQFWFKVKDERHSSSKVKTLAAVDVEKMNSIHEFVAATVTKNRLNQGLDVMRQHGIEIERKNTGDFLRWVVNDILDEEQALMEENGFTAADVGKHISNSARVFWFAETDKL